MKSSAPALAGLQEEQLGSAIGTWGQGKHDERPKPTFASDKCFG